MTKLNQKLISFILATLLVFTISACSKNGTAEVSRIPITSDEYTPGTTLSDINEALKNENTTTSSKINNTTSKADGTTASNPSTPSNNSNETSTVNHTIPSNLSFPITNPALPGQPQFDANLPLIEYSDLTKICDLDCWVKDWAYQGDTVYLLTDTPNEIYILNTNNPTNPQRISLPDNPNKIRLYNNKLYVSFDEPGGILIYNPATLKQEGKIEINARVYSFDIDGDDIYYTSSAHIDYIYHYSISKKESSVFEDDISMLYADLKYSKENNSLYISDSNASSRTSLLHYNTKTKELISGCYRGHDGSAIVTRYAKMHIFDGEFYWAQYKFPKNNVDAYNVFYKGAYDDSVDIFGVDNRGVVTTNGIYTKNGTQKLQFKFGSSTKILYTKSNNLIVINEEGIYIKKNVKP